MITPRREDAYHKARFYRLLTSIADNNALAQNLFFKGGTCAAMLERLDRFSVDLDFDMKKDANKNELKKELYKTFKKNELTIKDESKNTLQFFLRYKTPKEGQRNTIKVEAVDSALKENTYESQYFPEINRTLICQDIETMFANKLVAPLDRYEKNKSIAGRDIYDIHHFFLKGYKYNNNVILARTGKTPSAFFKTLRSFIDKKISNTALNQDLNPLLPQKEVSRAIKTLRTETLMFLKDEIKRAKD